MMTANATIILEYRVLASVHVFVINPKILHLHHMHNCIIWE